MTEKFKNEALRDFGESHNREAIKTALTQVDSMIRGNQLVACPIVGGKDLAGSESWERRDPSNSDVVVGLVRFGDTDVASEAIDRCRNAFPAWRDTPTEKRAAIMRTAANFMRRDKAFLTAIMIREAGKPWKEADADVAEAIDFCDYYALLAEQMAAPRRTEIVLGEDNTYFYQPRGLAVVISPWNFPLAIACGMVAAALVTGNTVILKPAEQTSIIASYLSKVFLEAGVPPNVYAFLPARGETVGRFLVQHAKIDMIAFTGSKAVGLEIVKSAAVVQEGQSSIKRVIAELGGKNAVIVDEDSDMDDAIRGVLYSAFGFSGQKCSACSRVLVVGTAYEPFVTRLAKAAADILIGEAKDPSTFVGPVIDQESADRLNAALKEFATTVPVAGQRSIAGLRGYYVPPTIFRDCPIGHKLWIDELFGPVVACSKVNSFEEAIIRATESQYALTGGVYTRSPSHLEFAKREFRVGNLYINRGCTGALVGRQPFGGFKMSGIGSKAGGPDYLLQFVEPRVISENTMRRGFTPDLS